MFDTTIHYRLHEYQILLLWALVPLFIHTLARIVAYCCEVRLGKL